MRPPNITLCNINNLILYNKHENASVFKLIYYDNWGRLIVKYENKKMWYTAFLTNY